MVAVSAWVIRTGALFCGIASLCLGPATAGALPLGAGETCAGEPATVVGTPTMAVVRGTVGADVIVTGGAGSARARGGDDLVCLTGATREVFAGAGDDTVTTGAATGASRTDLGAGDDDFTGGGQVDVVTGGDGTDQVDLGPGEDRWTHGTGDVADLGEGDDVATAWVALAPGALTGGPGADELSLSLCCTDDRQEWIVDNVREVASVDGRAIFAWSGFNRFEVSADRGTLEFLGSEADERVTAARFFNLGVVLERAEMGGGDDEVLLSRACCVGSIDGGSGTDWLRLLNNSDERSPALSPFVLVDLAAGFVQPTVETLSGIEHVEVEDFSTAVLRGDGLPNVFRVGTGCVVRVLGAGGADGLRTGRWSRCHGRSGSPPVVRAYGGPGADDLWGRNSDDRLFGGPGFDRVDGRRGSDTCEAERTVRCERRP